MDITLRGLLPNRTYNIQARATAGEESSAWTINYPFVTRGDDIKPSPVTNLMTFLVDGNMRIVWEPPGTNADGTPLEDLKDFRVSIRPIPDNPAYATKYIFTTDTTATFPKEVNAAAFGGYKPELSITVQARDIAGNLSDPVTQTKNKNRPNPPTALDWKAVGNAFVGSWTAPSTNIDGTAFTDPDGYQVKVSYLTTTVTFIVRQTTFDFSYEANKAAFGGSPRSPLSIEVRARDSVGQLSDAVSATASNDPPKKVTGVIGTPVTDGIKLVWNEMGDDDLTHYEIFSASTAGGVGVYQGSVPAPAREYIHTSFAYNTDHFMYVVAQDVFGLRSPDSDRTPALRPKSPFLVDATPPGATSLTATTATTGTDKPAAVNLTWPANSAEDLAGYHIRYSLNTNPRNWIFADVGDATATATMISGLQSQGAYVFQIRAYDKSINPGPWSAEASATASQSVIPMTNITSDIQVINQGILRSANYVESTPTVPGTGWLLSPSQLNIEQGRVNARVVSAGELRSNTLITDPTKGVVGQPLWSLNLDGNMSINDAQVRGKIVVGGPSDTAAEKNAISIASSTWGSGGSQWAIRADGTFDLKSGTGSRIELSNTGLIAHNGVEQTFNLSSAGNLSLKGNITATGGTIDGNMTVNARLTGGIISGSTIYGSVYSSNEDQNANQVRIGPNESVYGGSGPAVTFGAPSSGGVRAYLRYDDFTDNLAISNPNGTTFAGIEFQAAGTIAFYHRDEYNTTPEGQRLPGMIVDSRGPRIYERLSFSTQTRQQINLYNEDYGIGVQANTHYFRTNSGYAWFQGGAHSSVQNDPGPGGVRLMRVDSDGNLYVRGNVIAQSTTTGGGSGTTFDDAAYVKITTSQTISGLKNFTGGIQKNSASVYNVTENDARYALKSEIPGQTDLSGYMPKSGGLFTGIVGLSDTPIRFRSVSDANHYIVYNATMNGPEIAGYAGGRLGTMQTGTYVNALTWTGANVAVAGTLTVGGSPVITEASPATLVGGSGIGVNRQGTVTTISNLGALSVAGRTGDILLYAVDVQGVYYSGNPNLATTVQTDNTWGKASSVGTGTLYARDNHSHGTPNLPVTSIVAGTGISRTPAATGDVTISNTGVLSVTASGNMASSGGQNPAITISATPTFTSATIPTLSGAVSVAGILTPSSGIHLSASTYISPLGPSTSNWRIGAASSAASFFTRKYITGNTQYVSYGTTATEGFAVGPFAGLSSFEIGGDHKAFFRGKVEVWDELSIRRTDGTAAFTFRPNDGLGTFSLPDASLSGNVLIDGTVAYAKLSTVTQGMITQATQLSWSGLDVIPNSGFEVQAAGEDRPYGWFLGSNSSWVTSTTAYQGNRVIRLVAPAGTAFVSFSNSSRFPVRANGQYLCRFRYRQTAGTLHSPTIRVHSVTTDSQPLTYDNVNHIWYDAINGSGVVRHSALNVWTEVNFVVSMPATHHFVLTDVYAGEVATPAGGVTWEFDGFEMRPLVVSDDIGGVTVTKLLAGEILTDDINLGTAGRLWTGLSGATKNSGTRLVFQGNGVDADRGIFSWIGSSNTIRLGADGLFALRSASTTDYINLDSSKFEMYAGGVRQVLIQSGNVDITGKITATSGSIGGWDASGGNLSTAAGTSAANWIQLQPGTGIWAGDTAFANAKFSVSPAGAVKATTGMIGGFSMTEADGLWSGTTTDRVQMKPGAGIWAGGATYATAKFGISNTGEFKATDGTLSGTLTGGTIRTAASGKRVVLDPTNTLTFYGTDSAFGSTITGESYTGGYSGLVLNSGASSVGDNATYVQVRNDFFDVTVGTSSLNRSLRIEKDKINFSGFSGDIMVEASQFKAVHQIKSARFVPSVIGASPEGSATSVYSAYGIFADFQLWQNPYPKMNIGWHTGMRIYGDRSYGGIAFYTTQNGSNYTGYVMGITDSVDIGATTYVRAGLYGDAVYDSSNRVYSASNVPPYPVTSVNGMTGAVSGLASSSHGHNYWDVGAAASSHSHDYASSGHGHSGYLSTSHTGSWHNDYAIGAWTGWAGSQMGLSDDGTYMRIHSNGNVYRTAISRGITVTKSFVIDHPTPEKTQEKYLVHACLEGPESAVYYRGTVRIKGQRPGEGRQVVQLPEYFEDLTAEEGRTVQVTQMLESGDWHVLAAATYPKDGQFTIECLGGNLGFPGCSPKGSSECYHAVICPSPYAVTIAWEVKAVRKDAEQPVIEPAKSDYELYGDGPYTYLLKK